MTCKYASCSGLTSIVIPDSVTKIGEEAFTDCTGLTTVTLCKSITKIEFSAFERCSNLTTICIPNSVTEIEGRAFYDCTGLTSLTIGSGLTSIGYEAFYNCSNLSSIMIENGNKIYDSRNNCNAIIETASNKLILGCKNTFIPKGVKEIGREAFKCCSGLTYIIIPDGITEIGDYAFYDCSGLTAITIPKSVKYIGYLVFNDCLVLNDVYIFALIPPNYREVELSPEEKKYNLIPIVDLGNDLSSVTLHVPSSSMEIFKNAERWKEFGKIVAL